MMDNTTQYYDLFYFIIRIRNSFISPANGEIGASQQPKDSLI